MFRKIKLYGQLAKIVGSRSFKAKVSSAAEAVRFLISNFPHVESHMMEGYYQVKVGDYNLSKEELHHPSGQDDIFLIPTVQGAGSNAIPIIAGVALIALSFVSFGAGAWAGIAGSFGTGAGAAAGSVAAFSVGASLVLGGVAQLLTPVPSTDFVQGAKNPEESPSYSFNSVQNTSRQGLAVPVVYGEVLVGSITVSVGVDTTPI